MLPARQKNAQLPLRGNDSRPIRGFHIYSTIVTNIGHDAFAARVVLSSVQTQGYTEQIPAKVSEAMRLVPGARVGKGRPFPSLGSCEAMRYTGARMPALGSNRQPDLTRHATVRLNLRHAATAACHPHEIRGTSCEVEQDKGGWIPGPSDSPKWQQHHIKSPMRCTD